MESEYKRVKINSDGEAVFEEKPISDPQVFLQNSQDKDFEIAQALLKKGGGEEALKLMQEYISGKPKKLVDNILPFKKPATDEETEALDQI